MEKHEILISNKDNHKLMTIIQILNDGMVAFKLRTWADGYSVITFECTDQFYEMLLEDARRICYSKKGYLLIKDESLGEI